MNEFDNEKIKLLQAEVKEGLDIDEAIRKLHQYKFSITETMRFLVSEYRVGLGEAKSLVSSHPVWSEVVEASKPLHDELVREAKKHR